MTAHWHEEARRQLRATDPTSMHPTEWRHEWTTRRYRVGTLTVRCECSTWKRLSLILRGR